MEDEAGGAAVFQGFGVGVGDGVGKAAGGAHQRQGAVFEAVELGQTAGFEAARHEDDVAAGYHLVRERFVVGDAHPDFVRVARRQVAEGGFEVGRAGAEDGQL